MRPAFTWSSLIGGPSSVTEAYHHPHQLSLTARHGNEYHDATSLYTNMHIYAPALRNYYTTCLNPPNRKPNRLSYNIRYHGVFLRPTTSRDMARTF